MPYTPIGEFARGFSHILDPLRRGFVVLRAYFDDSGTHAGSKVVVWAGFMGEAEEWTVFETEWSALLKCENIKSFHSVDFEHGRGECQDWPLVRRELVSAEFRRVIEARNVIGIGATVRVDDWNLISDRCLISRFVNPTYLSFEHCMQQALHWAQVATYQQTGAIEKVSCIFDLRENEAAKCLDIAKRYEGGLVMSDWFEGATFARMRCTLPLQAADMLAYETYRLEVERLQTGAEPEPKKQLKSMLKGLPIYGQYYDEAALRILADQISEGGHPDLLSPQGSFSGPSS